MKARVVYTCQTCGSQSPKWLGKCPDCGAWNSFAEETFSDPQPQKNARSSAYTERPVLLADVTITSHDRLKTGIGEFDRVLGGGIVAGSVVLIGGDPGIGKSTISLQICAKVAEAGLRVLYVSGEESVAQTKMRSSRLGCAAAGQLYIVSQTDVTVIAEHIADLKPAVVIIDSVQVMFDPRIGPAPGSVSQVRECSAFLTQIAKSRGVTVFIIGHVTKEGTIAGPRVLEHVVDTVLYFEGERFMSHRILRAVKNRFGSTNEIGVFEMEASGLKEVANPSEIFLAERPQNASGSAVTAVLEGTRPLLVEVQALVSRTSFGYARRQAQGFDANRLSLLVAVLEKRVGLSLESEDIFVNVAGGIRIEDPAADLAVATAIHSAFRERTVARELMVIGEVGLSGEIRGVSQTALRVQEARKLGFKKCVLPAAGMKGMEYGRAIALTPVATLGEALAASSDCPAAVS